MGYGDNKPPKKTKKSAFGRKGKGSKPFPTELAKSTIKLTRVKK